MKWNETKIKLNKWKFNWPLYTIDAAINQYFPTESGADKRLLIKCLQP